MSEKQSNEQVEAFLNKESQWQEEYKYLRALIFNETELEVKSRLLCKMLYNVFTISTYQN